MQLFDLNSSLNNFSEILSIKDFLVDSLADSLMSLCVSFMALKILKSYLSRLILINSQPNFFSNAFCLCISSLVSLSL